MEAKQFDLQNVEVAKNQPEYKTLPAHKRRNGNLIMCYTMTPEERALFETTGEIWLQVMTFGNPLQPLRLAVDPKDMAFDRETYPLPPGYDNWADVWDNCKETPGFTIGCDMLYTGPGYKESIPSYWIKKQHDRETKVVECGFCSWEGFNADLEKNGHCPGCQSPTTKDHPNYEKPKK